MADYEHRGSGVLRVADGMHIPADPGNRDWRKYQAWLAEGNTPDPEPPRPVVSPSDRVRATLAADLTLAALVRKVAKVAGETEKDYIDGIAAEAKVQAREIT